MCARTRFPLQAAPVSKRLEEKIAKLREQIQKLLKVIEQILAGGGGSGLGAALSGDISQPN